VIGAGSPGGTRSPHPPAAWRLGDLRLDLDRPRILGIVNVTPDSFSDGGRFLDPDAACRHAERLVAEGADVLDVGGESTRPGSDPVPEAVELERVLPVIRRIRGLGTPISIDTTKAAVARAALEAGAAAVNDVSALDDPEMARVAAESGAGLILMHRGGPSRTMQDDPHYEDVVAEVVAHLAGRRDRARAAGVRREAIVLDPGIGFGKRLEHNLLLLAGLPALLALGSPVLIGVSRKHFVGSLSGAEHPEDRVPGSTAAAVLALARGARLFRVHDVAATRQALAVAAAILDAGATG